MRNLYAVFGLLLFLVSSPGNACAGSPEAPDNVVTSAINPAVLPDLKPYAPAPTLFGVYDPHGAMSQNQSLALEHKFVFWQKHDRKALVRDLARAQERGRSFMITIEPYTKAANWRDGGDRLFDEIVAGKFDRNIAAICADLASFEGDVFVRWGHEMEDPTGRYPWARKNAGGYKSAYRHVVEQCRKKLPLAQYVWSPKGEKNLKDYYPGDDFVDVVGISVWGLQRMDQDFYARDRGFFDAVGEKYRRVSHFGKPVFVAELGFAGDEKYRNKWIVQASDIQAIGTQFPLLKGVVYFNDREPHAWPGNYGKPDWRVPSKVVDRISSSQLAAISGLSLNRMIAQVSTLFPRSSVGRLAYLPSAVLFLLRPSLT